MKRSADIKKMVLLAMLAAMAYLMVATVRIPIVLWLSYEPKDVIITIGGFLLGPMASFAVSLAVSLLEMVTFSQTGPIGALMNLLSSCCFACTAAFIYKRRHTLGGAMGALAAGSALTVGAMLLWNYLITPLYMTGTSRSEVAAMLLPVFLPFNALKAGLNSALVLLLYKPLVTALRKTRLVQTTAAPRGRSRLGVYLFAAALLAACIGTILALRGR